MGLHETRSLFSTAGVRTILQRYWFAILLPALLLVGCRGSGPGTGEAETGEAIEAPPEDLEPGKVFASGEYAEPAKELVEQLKTAFPGVEFSVGWTAKRLHVTVHEATASEAVAGALTSSRKDVHHRIIGICLGLTAPETEELWVISKSETGSASGEKGTWQTFQGMLGSG
jgi:hypothetical protein